MSIGLCLSDLKERFALLTGNLTNDYDFFCTMGHLNSTSVIIHDIIVHDRSGVLKMDFNGIICNAAGIFASIS